MGRSETSAVVDLNVRASRLDRRIYESGGDDRRAVADGHELDGLGEIDGRLVSGHGDAQQRVCRAELVRIEPGLLVAEHDCHLLSLCHELFDEDSTLVQREHPGHASA